MCFGRWDQLLFPLFFTCHLPSWWFLPQSEKNQESSCLDCYNCRCSVAVAHSKCRPSRFRSSFQGSWRPSLSLSLHLFSPPVPWQKHCLHLLFCIRPLLCSWFLGSHLVLHILKMTQPGFFFRFHIWPGGTHGCFAYPLSAAFLPLLSQGSCSTAYFFRLFSCELDSSSCILQTPRNRCQTQHGFSWGLLTCQNVDEMLNMLKSLLKFFTDLFIFSNVFVFVFYYFITLLWVCSQACVKATGEEGHRIVMMVCW